MNIENTKAQMRKGVLEYVILLLFRDHEMYPSEVILKVKESKLIVVEGTLYPLLTRLKNDGILNYRWEESTSGAPRKYYSLTEIGHAFLKELSSTWDSLENAVKNAQQKN